MRVLGEWIKKNRRAKDWSVAELAHVLTLAGYETKEGTVRVWEAPSGRDPRQDVVDALERIFGSVAPVQRAPEQEALDRIADVLDRLAVIEQLTAEVARIAADVETLRHEIRGNEVAFREDKHRAER